MILQELKFLYVKLKTVDELAWMFFYIKNISFALSIALIVHLVNIGLGPFWIISAIRYKLMALVLGHVFCLVFSRDNRVLYLCFVFLFFLLLFLVE